MSNQPTIATNPHTGVTYDFRPLFDFTNKYGSDLKMITGALRKAVRYAHYIVIHKDDIGTAEATNYVDDMNALYDILLSIEQSATPA